MPNYISDEARVSAEAILEEPVSVRGRTVIREDSFIGSFTLVNEDTTIHVSTTIGKYCSIEQLEELRQREDFQYFKVG